MLDYYLWHVAVEQLVLLVHDHVVHLQVGEIVHRLMMLAEELAFPLHELLPLDVDRLGQLQALAGDLDIIVVAILERQAGGESDQERNAKRKPNQLIHNALAPNPARISVTDHLFYSINSAAGARNT